MISRFFWKVVDTFVIDGAINAGAFLTELTGDVGRFSTTGNVRNYALYFFLGVILLFWWIAFWVTGSEIWKPFLDCSSATR